jgi:hypothetical protein
MTDTRLRMHTALHTALRIHAGTVLAYLNIVGRPVTLKLRKAEAYNADGSLVPSSAATSSATASSTPTAPPALQGTPRNRGGSGSVQVLQLTTL